MSKVGLPRSRLTLCCDHSNGYPRVGQKHGRCSDRQAQVERGAYVTNTLPGRQCRPHFTLRSHSHSLQRRRGYQLARDVDSVQYIPDI